ncbi:MAG: hypothetical protein M1834_002679 [Cirrosporium novae-zelandiae]|nr:MAG: hypothetical protein M1834_002679 [Cirrosporium novae-zelandiae]
MAAADYFAESSLDIERKLMTIPWTEEDLENLARDIDERTTGLQGLIRGYLVRKRLFIRNGDVDFDDENDGFISGSDGADDEVDNDETTTNGGDSDAIVAIIDESDSNKGESDKTDNGNLNDDGADNDGATYVAADSNEAANNKIENEEINRDGFNSEQANSGELNNNEASSRSTETPPWKIGIPSLHEDDGLCAFCRDISFDALLHTTDSSMYLPIPLGPLQTIVKKTHCSFCRLVSHTASILLHETIENIGNVVKAIDCKLIGDPEWNRYASRIRNICFELTLLLPNGGEPVLGTGCIHQILNGDEIPPEQKFNDSRFVKDRIDTDLVKSWLRTCEQEHVSLTLQYNSFNASFEPPRVTSIHDPSALIIQPCRPISLTSSTYDLLVIDVRRECLADVRFDARYVALSYVWGGPQPFQNVKARAVELHEPHSISIKNEMIPGTIRDAIQLVAHIGEKYLWVDSLCIVQDDVENKMTQIANMGNIYSRAILTIVAAYGDNARAGLPGVQPHSRKSTQKIEYVQGMILANVLPYMDQTIDGSAWNTRGWTYQERELSKRYLFVSERQVYFHCNRRTCNEDAGLRDVAYRGGRALRIRGERHPIWNNYRRAVESFTKRSLTFESDGVNAFQGLTALLQPAFKGDFLFGLPETELDIALLWQPGSLIRRRVDPDTGSPLFPSWSWAGWVGEIKYKWTKHLLDDLSRVQWQDTGSRAGHDSSFTSDELRAPRGGTHGAWEYVMTAEQGPPFYFERDNPDIWCLHPTAPKDQRIPYSLIRPGSHELRFKALTAFFRISLTPHPFQFDMISSCEKDNHILCPHNIFDADGFIAGTIYIPAHTVATLPSEPNEFVCLSRRRGHYTESTFHKVYEPYKNYTSYPPPTDDTKNVSNHVAIYPNQQSVERAYDKYDHRRYNKNKPWPLYNVMMIERKDGVAYRVAIGIIHVTAFVQAKPTWKLITLS